MVDERVVAKLKNKLDKILTRNDYRGAVEVLRELCEADPTAPRWPHKLGDIQRKLDDKEDAVRCYAIAVDLYADQGFIARAVAMARTILDLDPSRADILERVDPEAARQLHRRERPNAPSSRPAPAAAPAPMQTTHEPGLIADGMPVSIMRKGVVGAEPRKAPTGRPVRHSMVIEDRAPITEAGPMRHPMVIRDGSSPLGDEADEMGEPSEEVLPHEASTEPPPLTSEPLPAALAGSAPATGESLPAALAGSPSDPVLRAREARRLLAFETLSLPPPGGSLSDPVAPTSSPPEREVHFPAPPRVPQVHHVPLDDVEPLMLGPDKRPYEARVSSRPKERPSMEIDVTDLELGDREPVPSEESMRPEPPSAAKLSQLPLFPLFAEMPKPLLKDLVTGSELIELEEGAYLIRKGDPADALYGIVEGSVQIVVPDQHLEVTLAEGDVLGEACLLAGERRHANAIVRGHLVALRIPRGLLHELIAKYPRLAEVLLELLTRRLLGNLLRASPLFEEFDASARRDLVSRIEVRRAPQGAILAEAGKAMDGLYINLTGQLEETLPDGSDRRVYGPGSMFGHQSLVGEEPSPVTLRALNHMVVLRLPSAEFMPLLLQYPSLLSHVAEMTQATVAHVST